jgi:hypothetical protein
MSPRAWLPPPPGPDDPHRCHCGGEWFNPRLYAECKRCRDAYARALAIVRQVFPGARIVGAPGIPYPPQTTAETHSAGERKL